MKGIRWVILTRIFITALMTIACAQVKPVQESNVSPMTFGNVDFEIALSPKWKRRDTSESFEWEDESEMQEIVISVLTADDPMDSKLRLTTAKRLMEIRQKSIDEISEGKTQMTKVETSEGVDLTELVVRGVDNAYGMQVYTAVIVRPTRAVTFAYYKYSPLMTNEVFKQRSKEMRLMLKVH